MRVLVNLQNPTLLKKLLGLAREERRSLDEVVAAVLDTVEATIPEPKGLVRLPENSASVGVRAIDRHVQNVRDTLKASPTGLTTQELMMLLKKDRITMRAALQVLLERGELVRTETPTAGRPAFLYSLSNPSGEGTP